MTHTIPSYYGEGPTDLGPIDLPHWHEFMHYLYLPVRIPERDLRNVPNHVRLSDGPWFRLPERLWFLDEAVRTALHNARAIAPHLYDPYVYVTARRGYATPGNPLNRPGWHCDDFGGLDLNYIWTDAFPTRVLRSTKPLTIPEDDQQSMMVMADLAHVAMEMDHPIYSVEDVPLGHLLRLSPYVIHDTPVIPAPGGMRSFFKISVSDHRYNLLGNSHNYALDYDWTMYDRATLRNQPGARAERDYVIEDQP